MMRISPHHPLRRFFAGFVPKFLPADPGIVSYVADPPVDFVHVENLPFPNSV
jgi:hypothetical protein